MDVSGDLRNSTAAAVSLHVGIPVMIAAAAVWMRPRAVLARTARAYPAVVAAVVLATANHFVLDLLVGAACSLPGLAVARALPGPVPPDTPAAPAAGG